MFDPTVLPELLHDASVIEQALPFLSEEQQEQMGPHLIGLQRSIDFVQRFNS